MFRFNDVSANNIWHTVASAYRARTLGAVKAASFAQRKPTSIGTNGHP